MTTYDTDYDIREATGSVNIAEDLPEEFLEDLGSQLAGWIQSDELSREEWIQDQEDWLKLASQVRETKSFPWHNASNVKYPLVTVAAMQFHARALPGLINSSTPVMTKHLGRDEGNQKQARSQRVRKYMSFQVLEEMEEWLDELDRMLFVLPVIGLCYKKTFYSDSAQRMKSVMCLPQEVVVNYHAQDYDRARMTHKIPMDSNELIELQRQGIFSDVDLGSAEQKSVPGPRDETLGFSNVGGADEDEPYIILESHCWLDLDQDGYKEPYVVTLEENTGKILRIVARWEDGEVEYTDDERVAKINPTTFFTPFIFLPDPNSSVYGIGFGRLLGPTNEAANTLVNQLVDAGTLSNLQSGFLGRGIKVKGGAVRFRPGEWKNVNVGGDDLQKSVYPLPVREPSGTLLSLLQLLITSGERVSSVSDIMVGENPGQNQPATTTMAVLEQGLAVFTGIFRRIHRALGKEYKKLYNLNHRYLDEENYRNFLFSDMEEQLERLRQGGDATDEEIEQVRQIMEEEMASVGRDDFAKDDLEIVPGSDPNMVTDAQKMVKSQSLMEKLAAGLPINVGEVTRRMLEAEQHEDIEDLMNIPPAPPSVEERELQLEALKEERETIDSYFDNLLKVAQAEGQEEGNQIQLYRGIVDDTIKVAKAEREAAQSGPRGANEANEAPIESPEPVPGQE